ncbi:MAG: zinc ribbon domain-containing protein [Clostridia bacterium]|nr:zinc ribbon domain-containing protein [Clostridia bacterium]
MNCRKCGAEIIEKCKNCPECGAVLSNNSDPSKNKRMHCSVNRNVIVIVVVILFAAVIAGVLRNNDKHESESLEKGAEIVADHTVAQEVAYDYAANILLADIPSDYENFKNTTTIDWDAFFGKLNENGVFSGDAQVAYLEFFSENARFESVTDGYSYFKINTVSVTDYPYTEIHKEISLFGKMFRPLSLSAVNYIRFSDIRTLTSVILSVEFYDENDNIIATEQIDMMVVAESDEYYSQRNYSILYDNFFIEKFITSFYSEEISTGMSE